MGAGASAESGADQGLGNAASSSAALALFSSSEIKSLHKTFLLASEGEDTAPLEAIEMMPQLAFNPLVSCMLAALARRRVRSKQSQDDHAPHQPIEYTEEFGPGPLGLVLDKPVGPAADDGVGPDEFGAMVRDVAEGSAAADATRKIQKGDLLIAVGDFGVEGMPLEGTMKTVGAQERPMTLKFRRPSGPDRRPGSRASDGSGRPPEVSDAPANRITFDEFATTLAAFSPKASDSVKRAALFSIFDDDDGEGAIAVEDIQRVLLHSIDLGLRDDEDEGGGGTAEVVIASNATDLVHGISGRSFLTREAFDKLVTEEVLDAYMTVIL